MDVILPQGQYFKGFLGPFSWRGVPNFAVLTGENGAGKTQLLEMIYQATQGHIPRSILPNVTIPRDSVAFFRQSLLLSREGGPVELIEVQKSAEKYARAVKSGDPIEDVPYSDYFPEVERANLSELRAMDLPELSRRLPSTMDIPRRVDSERFFDQIFISISKACLRFALREANAAHVALLESRQTTIDIIRSQNRERPPWEEIGRLFSLANLGYQFEPPGQLDGAPYTPRLKTPSGALISFFDLSRGEQNILGLILLFYAMRMNGSRLNLLLLDEPEAHLHSSLIPKFIAIIQDIIVPEFGCRVIMATHRLETIVQAPEAALYFLARNPRAVSKTTPRAATAALSSALILAQRSSVSVLVEDQDDELFYRTVFESLVRLGVWESEHAIEFKSVAKTAVDIEDGGGATMVAKKIEAIHKIVDVFDNIAPYRLLFGLIDRDAENKKSPGMEVLQRYSMENYVFEPMVIYCHLLSSSAAPYVKGLDWLGPGDQAKVRELPCGQKQAITDAIVSQVESIWKSGPVANVVKLESDELEKVSVLYVEGLDVFTTLQLPKWLIDRRGHDLQKVLQEVFSAKVNAGALRKVFGELRVVPQELHEIFSSFVQQNTKESA